MLKIKGIVWDVLTFLCRQLIMTLGNDMSYWISVAGNLTQFLWFSFGSEQKSVPNSSVTNSFGAWESIFASQCRGFVSAKCSVASSNYIFAWLMLQVPGILFEEFVFWAPDASGSRFSSLLGSFRRHFETSINPGLGPWIFIFVWIPKKSFFSIVKSIRNQSILGWACGSLFFLDSSGKVNQKSINSGLGLWIFLFVWIRRKSQSETNQSRPGPLDLQRPAEESGRTCNFAALSFVSLSQMHPFRREFKTFGLQLQTWNLNLLNGNH